VSKIEANLMNGESIIYKTQRHWSMLLVPGIVALFFIPGALFMLFSKMFGPSFVMLLVGCSWFLLRFLDRKSSEFAVTNRRVIIHVGVVRTRSVELQLEKVEALGVDQGLLGKLMGYGSVVVGGTGGTKEVFKFIEKPFEFRQKVQEQLPNAK
jgi:uncharacterized membrane protein YdbT with pleckstrin-like domain